MDKEWTKFPRISNEYIKGVESFLEFAYTRGRPQGREILCPCAKWKNCIWARRHVTYVLVLKWLKSQEGGGG